jgi:hypothetical protein
MPNPTIRERFSNAWNAFVAKEKRKDAEDAAFKNNSLGYLNTVREDKTRLRIGSERTIIASIYNRIAVDVAAINLQHSRVDQNGKYLEPIDSELNNCLRLSANIDQTAREFMVDAVLSLLDDGQVAVVPVDTTVDILNNNSYDILSIRTARIVQWYPEHVRVDCYNDRNGRHEEVTLPKSVVAIVENPFYEVMNKPNSTLNRLKNKLALLDATDDKQNSNKLNIIIQMPYGLKGKNREERAQQRIKDVEMQLVDSKYGIAYMDATEKIVQLGHPIENKLLEEIEFLTDQLYAQLGMTPAVFDGTAQEQEMLNYYNRTLEPILAAFIDEFNRKFLTKTARTQGQAINYFRDPFRLAPVEKLAAIADSFTANEIVSANEFRAVLGFQPVDDARADALLNKNINPLKDDPNASVPMASDDASLEDGGMGSGVDIESLSAEEAEEYLRQLDELEKELDGVNSNE